MVHCMDVTNPKVAFLKVLDNSIYNRLDSIAEKKGIDTNELIAHFEKNGTDMSKNKPQEMYPAYRKIQPPRRITLFASTS